jgi:hypothetical protein
LNAIALSNSGIYPTFESQTERMEKLDAHTTLKYPRNVAVNFRKLDKATLVRILRFYGVSPNPELSTSEIAAMTARVFHTASVNEKEVLDKLSLKYFGSSKTQESTGTSKKRTYSSREVLDATPAKQGEQVSIIYYSVDN